MWDFIVTQPSMGFPAGSDGKESACNAGEPDSIPGQEDPLEKGMAIPSSRATNTFTFFTSKGRKKKHIYINTRAYASSIHCE